MGKLGENFEIAPSEAMSADKPIGSAIGSALVRPEMWLSMSDLMTLADIKQASASEAIKKGKWRGADLAVRMVAAGRGGAGGKVPQVHADTLYLAR